MQNGDPKAAAVVVVIDCVRLISISTSKKRIA